MNSSINRILIALFIAGVVCSNVSGDIAPIAVLAAVALTLICVQEGLRR